MPRAAAAIKMSSFFSCIEIKNGYLVTISVIRFGNLLDFGPLFKAFGNN